MTRISILINKNLIRILIFML